MKIFTIIFLLSIPIYSLSQDSLSNHYKIYNTATQKQVDIADIINSVKNTDVLFFGEEHNDSIGHCLELSILKQLALVYPNRVALSMEMFETDCQTVLNEYLEGFIKEKNLITDARTWPNYKDYRPMIEFAKTNHSPVIAANAPSRYTSMTNRFGLSSLQQLSTTGKSFLPPLPIDTATGPYYDKFKEIMGGHGSMPGMQLYQAQNLWDATMGWSIARFYRAHKGFKVLQLNGGFHSEEKLGAAAQLKKYAPDVRMINIAVFADESFAKPDWSKFSKNGDYIIITDPNLPRSF
jgi:uncharacterized iron-regulated protein